MKNLFIYICILISIAISLSSCEKSNNGDLDGMWYMTRIDSLPTGKSVDARATRISWSVQGKLMQVYNYNDDTEYHHIIMSRFEKNDNKLIISDPFIYNRMEGDIFLTQDSLYKLRPYGINSLPDTFIIEQLSDQKLQIADDIIRLYFDKY